MKRILSLILILIANSNFAQNCNIGNEDSIGFDNSAGPGWANYLLGVKFKLPTNGTLHSFNLLGRNTGSKVIMALYKDTNNAPGNLIVTSNIDTVVAGLVSLPVSSIQLLAGDYWIMAIYNMDGSHTFTTTSDTGNTVYYLPLTFGNPIPANASNFISYNGQDFTYFLEISCETVGILDIGNLANISFYPNPVIDLFTINVGKNLIGSTYYITDLLGKQILTDKLMNETSSIDISHLETGVYLLLVGEQRTKTLKLIKK